MDNFELLRLRRQAGLSQPALGAAIGYSRQAITKWERGVHPIPADVIPAIIAACTPQAAQSEPAKEDRAHVAKALSEYTKIRGWPNATHETVRDTWATYSYSPPEAVRLAIAEKFPDSVGKW